MGYVRQCLALSDCVDAHLVQGRPSIVHTSRVGIEDLLCDLHMAQVIAGIREWSPATGEMDLLPQYTYGPIVAGAGGGK
jgi:hypothetical protein